ncbi:glycosyltransferase family 2 protein [Campylobacter canadensis]|uniref:glycosyltransferase family 2 protein n=1 Tax=Campylobacter canadensis TaxID=449520 RepID=UPI0015570855|nr:glycosyltransferase family 2 protein [Campylobacter canadensis]MBZ7995618.1 glycosyltransferase family 2 protein [Campylobacter canadensis]
MKVGIAVPIYNTQEYLKECLDSILKQKFNNFEVCLINDGSSDDSLKIALEYVKKDKRFFIIDKVNKGQSAARNNAIAYFKNEISFTLDKKDDDFIYYKSTNKKDIKNIICSRKKKQLKVTSITHIIFLDSDDYWHEDILSLCAKNALSNDIVWFDFKMFTDELDESFNPSWNRMRKYDFNKDIILKNQDIINLFKEHQTTQFPFMVDGLINFSYLKKLDLSLLNDGYAEDHYFGLMLFLQASSVYVLNKQLYFYRVRVNSSCNFDKKITKDSILPHFKELQDIFFNDYDMAKRFYNFKGYLISAYNIMLFFKAHGKYGQIAHNIVCFYYNHLLSLAKFYVYPNNCLKYFEEIEEYLKDNNYANFGARIRVRTSLAYKLGLACINIKDKIKLPFLLIKVAKAHKNEKIKNCNLSFIKQYQDYNAALQLKEHKTYKLGQELINLKKNWYKGAIFSFIKNVKKLYEKK